MRLLKIILLTFVVVSLSLPASFAKDLKVRKLTRSVYIEFTRMPISQARRQLSGYTVLAKTRNLGDRSTRAMLPFSGVAVLYFSPNGTLLAWSGKSQKVESGQWRVVRFTKKGRNRICFKFRTTGTGAVCTVPGARIFGESTQGNPFRLRANAAVPFRLGRVGLSLQGLADRLN